MMRKTMRMLSIPNTGIMLRPTMRSSGLRIQRVRVRAGLGMDIVRINWWKFVETMYQTEGRVYKVVYRTEYICMCCKSFFMLRI